MTAGEPIFLSSCLDLRAAELLHRQLQERLLAGQPIILDGRQVERASTPCLQILASAARSAQARDLSFALVEPSIELRAAAADLGLTGFLDIQRA